MKKLFILLVLFSLVGCSKTNLEDTKEHACSAWKQAGYTCVGYEGYEYGLFGAQVWYTLSREETPGVVYSGYVQKWDNEYHLYGPRVINAILTKTN